MADQASLLRWGIENSAPGELLRVGNEVKSGVRTDLTSAMLAHIMGKSNADRMIECMHVIEGRWIEPESGEDRGGEITLEDKLRAWDDLEMLIEDLDNANDLKVLKLWTPIVAALSDEIDEVRMRACWVCGTAVQNNPRAQEAFLELDPLPTINKLITSATSSAATRSKAMYCLSATLKHSPAALKRFDELDGWKVLNSSLSDSSIVLRTKTAFLLSSMILQSSPLASSSFTDFENPIPIAWRTSRYVSAFRRSSILSTLLASLSKGKALPTGPNGDEDEEGIDADYQEKALRVLVNLAAQTTSSGDAESGMNEEEKHSAREIVESLESEGIELEEIGLAKEEWEEFKVGLQ